MFSVSSQGGNNTSPGICGSSLGTIENSQTLVLVVGLAIMFILVIYSRLVIMSIAFIQEQSCTLFFNWFDSTILKHDTLTMSHGVCLGDL